MIVIQQRENKRKSSSQKTQAAKCLRYDLRDYIASYEFVSLSNVLTSYEMLQISQYEIPEMRGFILHPLQWMQIIVY